MSLRHFLLLGMAFLLSLWYFVLLQEVLIYERIAESTV